MKLSEYTIEVKDYPSKKQSLLFNTINGTIIVIPKNYLQMKRLDNITDLQIKDILFNKFLVEDNINEKEIVEKRLNQMKYDTNSIIFTLAQTLKCNMHCVYCY